MKENRQNYYGNLCTEMYEILHEKAPKEELAFYLSYAKTGDKILEPLCGSGRFLVPFLERGYDIQGMDLSQEMIQKARQKNPEVKITQADLIGFVSKERFDYIFIPSGSISLFTQTDRCKAALRKLKELLAPQGKLVFSAETMADRCADDMDYQVLARVKTKEGFDMILKSKNTYDAKTQTQFSPGIYELYDHGHLLQSEIMDFQIHLYQYGEMEQRLREAGFTSIITYASYQKEIADSQSRMFLFECS